MVESNRSGGRVLVISPRFPPSNAADCHRTRLLLPYLAANGWQAEVLAVDAADVPVPQDEWLEQQLPNSIPVHRIRAWKLAGWGLQGLAQRAFWPIYRKGNELLGSGRFDLVFFSTTEFLLHLLGPMWRNRWGVPFCMDYQDPWVNDYYDQRPELKPPGGRLKYGIVSLLHEFGERYVVRRCSGLLAVSPAYLETLARRYGEAAYSQPQLAAGFPAEPREMAGDCCSEPKAAADHVKVWRYIGRGGPDMSRAATAFFRAWQAGIDRSEVARGEIRLETLGTSYAAAGRGQKSFESLVQQMDLRASVVERPDRLCYSDMLHLLQASDALIVFGSDDPAYTASKIYPYLLAGKPLLAIFHARSTVVDVMRAGGGVLVTFDESTDDAQLTGRIHDIWFKQRMFERVVPLNEEEFSPYTARTQAAGIARWFDDVTHHVA